MVSLRRHYRKGDTLGRIIRRKSITTQIEKQIITGLIANDHFCHSIINSINLDYFRLKFAKPVLNWIDEYYREYNEAPKDNIQGIFESERDNLKVGEGKLISNFLSGLSDEYERTNFNSQYQIDKAKDYFTKRSLELHFKKGLSLVQRGKVKQAKEFVSTFHQKNQDLETVFNPFDKEEVFNLDIEDDENYLFKFDGSIGDLLGWFERGWLVAVTAPEKRGKTWWLEEFIFQALTYGLKVVWFSLEMNKVQLKKRFYSRLTGLPKEEIGRVVFPIFDCINNQEGTCKKKCRTNKVNNLLAGLEDNESPDFKDFPLYKTCTACRGKKDYSPAVWFNKAKKKPKMTPRRIMAKVKAFKQLFLFGTNLRIQPFPAFTAGSDDLISAVNNLEYGEGFIPDLIVTDYLDIQKHDGSREQINIIWQQAKSIAASKNICYLTADQSDAAGRKQLSLKQHNFSDDKRKDGHLDMRIGLNQTPEEKVRGIMRLNVLFHRHNEFHIDQEVIALQSLHLGQPLLDSEWLRKK